MSKRTNSVIVRGSANLDVLDDAASVLRKENAKFVISVKNGAVRTSEDTVHYRAFVHFQNRKRLNAVQKLFQGGICEAVKGTQKARAGATDVVVSSHTPKTRKVLSRGLAVPEPAKNLNKSELYPWQRCLLEWAAGPTDDRKIVWLYDIVGSQGKTAMSKYLCVEFGAVILPAQEKPMLATAKANDSCLYIVPLQREFVSVSMSAVEAIKDGFYTSGQGRNASVIRAHPKIIIFANRPPTEEEEDSLSSDRLVLVNLSRGYDSLAQLVKSGASMPEEPAPALVASDDDDNDCWCQRKDGRKLSRKRKNCSRAHEPTCPHRNEAPVPVKGEAVRVFSSQISGYTNGKIVDCYLRKKIWWVEIEYMIKKETFVKELPFTVEEPDLQCLREGFYPGAKKQKID